MCGWNSAMAVAFLHCQRHFNEPFLMKNGLSVSNMQAGVEISLVRYRAMDGTTNIGQF